MREARAAWHRGAALAAVCLLLFTFQGCHGDKGGGDKASSESKGNADSKLGSGKSGSGKGGSDQGSGGSDSSSEGRNGSDAKGAVPADSVKIAKEDQARAGIQVAAAVVRSMPRTLITAGQVAMDERHTDHIGALADGRIENVFVLPGDRVRRGQTLATLHSHTVHETVAALTQAFAAVSRQQSAVSYATEARDRYNKLYEIQAASLEEKQRSEQGLAQANKDLIDAQANVVAEREHLAELLQVAPVSLRPGTLYQKELIPVRAVADGVVITRSITPGQVVNTGDEAFVTSNLSTVWVNAAVNEKDLPLVRAGEAATVTLQSPAGQGNARMVQGNATQKSATQGMAGRVTMLGDVVDPQTRTLPVRLSIPNPEMRLRPGMFVTAAIAEPATHTAIFVPADAMQDVNGFQVVFVTADGVTFQARAVKTGAQTDGMVEVVEGLGPADHVVVNGAFMVKGELLKGTVGEG